MLALSHIDLEEEGDAGNIKEPVAGVAEVLAVDGIVAQVVVEGEVSEIGVEVQVDSVDVGLEPEMLAATSDGGDALASDQVVLLGVHGEVGAVADISVPLPVPSDVAVGIVINAGEVLVTVHLDDGLVLDGGDELVHLLDVLGLLRGEAESGEHSVVDLVEEGVTSEGGGASDSSSGSEFHFFKFEL